MLNPVNSVFAILLCLAVNTTRAQTGNPREKARLLDSLYTSLYAACSFNGNVLFAEQGTVVFEKSYGLASETTGQPLNRKTVFELASVSKQFTAAGIVLLKKQGKLNYDDHLSKYIPELGFYDSVTIRNLLNHTGGIPDYMDLFKEKWDRNKIACNDDVISAFATYRPPAEFHPNEKWVYSNTDYVLLASVIERVSKQTFSQFMEEYIFRPLKMKHTSVYRRIYAPEKMKNYALGYGTDSLFNKVYPYSWGNASQVYYLDGVVGDGMVNSNLEDLLRWDRALYGDKLFNTGDKKEMFSSVKTKDGKESNYGFGWRIYKTDAYGKMVNHSGSWAGYISFIERHLDNDKTIILLQNANTPVSKIALSEARKILYGIRLAQKRDTAIILNPAGLDQYLGIYAGASFPKKVVVFKKGDRLLARYAGLKVSGFPLDAYPGHTFRCDPQDIEMIFNPAKHSLLFKEDNSQFTLQRVE